MTRTILPGAEISGLQSSIPAHLHFQPPNNVGWHNNRETGIAIYFILKKTKDKTQKTLYSLSTQSILCKFFSLVPYMILTGILQDSVLHMPNLHVQNSVQVMEQNLHPHLSKWCVELHNIEFFLQIWGSERTRNCQNTATMIPLDTDHIHQSVNTHWVWRKGQQHSSSPLVNISLKCKLENILIDGLFYSYFHHSRSAWSGIFHCQNR